jgi:hypothetical protein
MVWIGYISSNTYNDDLGNDDIYTRRQPVQCNLDVAWRTIGTRGQHQYPSISSSQQPLLSHLSHRSASAQPTVPQVPRSEIARLGPKINPKGPSSCELGLGSLNLKLFQFDLTPIVPVYDF